MDEAIDPVVVGAGVRASGGSEIEDPGLLSLALRDLAPEQLALLADLAPQVDQPVLRARIADVAWSYGDRSRSDLLDMAIDAYRTTFPGSSAGRDTWRRALQLARRRGSEGRRQISTCARRAIWSERPSSVGARRARARRPSLGSPDRASRS